MPHRLLEVLTAMAEFIGAVDEPVADLQAAITGEIAVEVDDPLLQAHGEGEDLEGGAGLVGVVDTAVAPLLQLRLAQGCFEVLLGNGGVLLHGRQLFRLQGIGNNGEVVEVVARVGGHGQDAPGVGVHNDAEAAVLDVVFFNALLQRLFRKALDGGVEGEVQVAAVLGVDVVFILG